MTDLPAVGRPATTALGHAGITTLDHVAEHTEAELVEIQDSLQGLPGLLSSGPQLDKLVVDVVWDDGTLQAWADDTYGDAVVLVTSLLVDV